MTKHRGLAFVETCVHSLLVGAVGNCRANQFLSFVAPAAVFQQRGKAAPAASFQQTGLKSGAATSCQKLGISFSIAIYQLGKLGHAQVVGFSPRSALMMK